VTGVQTCALPICRAPAVFLIVVYQHHRDLASPKPAGGRELYAATMGRCDPLLNRPRHRLTLPREREFRAGAGGAIRSGFGQRLGSLVAC